MKLWKWFVKCPMLFLLPAGWLGLTAFTWSEGRMPEALEKNMIENPAFTALLQSEPDSILDDFEDDEDDEEMAGINGPDSGSGLIESTENALSGKAQMADGSSKEDAKDGGSKSGNVSDEGQDDGFGITEQDALDDKTRPGVTKYKEYKKTETDSQYYSDPGKKALTTEYTYEKVDKSYFDDAVFIGDSRTVGMQDYSGLDNAQFFAKTGLNVYEVLEDKFIQDPETGKDVSVAHMLKTNRYGKIYFMVGINELGTGNTGTFQKAYERVLRKFRKWQPDAVIYIQGIIPVSKERASEDAIFNNVNINDKNVAIAQLANGTDTFYLDVSGKLTDKGGYLKADYTFDNIHMYAQYYELWTNYLMKHAVVR